MSRIRANQITNQSADGAPTVQNGLIITGVTTSTTFSGSGASLTNIPDSALSVVTASKLTGALPAISGANLTNLDASDLASGTVPTARLGSGTANSSTFLAGDSTFKTVTGTTINNNASERIITGSGTANTLEGQSTVTFDGTQFRVNAGNTSSLQVDGLYCYAKIGGVKLWRGAGNRSHNTGLGHDTLNNASGGSDCTAVGHNALHNSTSGSANTAVGSHTLYSNSTGNGNTAVGDYALYDNTTGIANVAVGGWDGTTVSALRENTTGSNNVAMGVGANESNETSNDNVAVGYKALFANTASDIVGVGNSALGSNTTGLRNTAVGHRALANNTTGGYNTAVGRHALTNNTSGT